MAHEKNCATRSIFGATPQLFCGLGKNSFWMELVAKGRLRVCDLVRVTVWGDEE